MKSIRILALLAFATATASAQIVVIQGTDLITNSRTTLNNNFSFLNTLLGGGFSQFSGPTATRVYTLPDAAATIVTVASAGAAPCTFLGNFTGSTATPTATAPGSGLACAGSAPVLNTAVALTIAAAQAGDPFFCDDSNGTTAMICSLPAKALAAYKAGQVFPMRSTTANPVSINVNGVGIVSLKAYDGSSSPPTIPALVPFLGFYDGLVVRAMSWQPAGGALSSIAPNTLLANSTNGSAVPTATGLGSGLGWCGTTPNIQPCLNSAVALTIAAAQSGAPLYARSANGTTAYTATLSSARSLTAYTPGMKVLLNADTTCATSCSLNVDGVGLVNIKKKDCSTDPGGVLVANQPQDVWYNGTNFCLVYN